MLSPRKHEDGVLFFKTVMHCCAAGADKGWDWWVEENQFL